MEYCFSKIGQRIKKMRKKTVKPGKITAYGKEKNYSQGEFAEDFCMSKSTVVAIEKGDEKAIGSHIFDLCKAFGCDVGYLLGEYECETKEKQDIQDVTGLSEKAIDRLLLQGSIPDRTLLSLLIEYTWLWLKLEEYLTAIFREEQIYQDNDGDRQWKKYIDRRIANYGEDLMRLILTTPRIKEHFASQIYDNEPPEGFEYEE